MSDAASSGVLEPTQDERTMAILAHVLQLVGWWIAPLIIFLVRRESRFVSFHALQALLLQAAYLVLIVALGLGFFVFAFAGVVAQSNGPQPSQGPPPALFFFFPLIWLGMMGFWVLMLVCAILYGIKAGRGEWAEYPVIGPLARRMLKIGPGGVPLSV